jgi:hypothetical protein
MGYCTRIACDFEQIMYNIGYVAGYSSSAV